MENLTPEIVKIHCAIQNFKAIGSWRMAEIFTELLNQAIKKAQLGS